MSIFENNRRRFPAVVLVLFSIFYYYAFKYLKTQLQLVLYLEVFFKYIFKKSEGGILKKKL